MSEAQPPILVIAGPTATGKTGVALELARALEGELIGADSVQVYRGFDIGSAKPSADELAGVPHHLIDVLQPDQEIDAAAYASLADRAIDRSLAPSRWSTPAGSTAGHAGFFPLLEGDVLRWVVPASHHRRIADATGSPKARPCRCRQQGTRTERVVAVDMGGDGVRCAV